MSEVESLIPHRPPFLYLDRILTATEFEIIGIKTFSDSDQFLRGSFPEFDFVPGMVLIESMAQCGGAGIKKLGQGSGHSQSVCALIGGATVYCGTAHCASHG